MQDRLKTEAFKLSQTRSAIEQPEEQSTGIEQVDRQDSHLFQGI